MPETRRSDRKNQKPEVSSEVSVSVVPNIFVSRANIGRVKLHQRYVSYSRGHLASTSAYKHGPAPHQHSTAPGSKVSDAAGGRQHEQQRRRAALRRRSAGRRPGCSTCRPGARHRQRCAVQTKGPTQTAAGYRQLGRRGARAEMEPGKYIPSRHRRAAPDACYGQPGAWHCLVQLAMLGMTNLRLS